MIIRSVIIDFLMMYLQEMKDVITGRIVLKDLLTMPLRVILFPLGVVLISYDLHLKRVKYENDSIEGGWSLAYATQYTLYMVDKDLLKHSKVSAWNHQEDSK